MAHTSADATSLSPWWRHSVILVMIAGFSVLTLVTVLTYTNAPPIPERAVDATGTVVFTGTDILMGQEVFLKYGLMEHGTLWGHGAYLGPDYSAEYLHRLSEVTRDTIATEKYGKLFAQLSTDQQSVASARTITELKENRYDPASRTLRLSSGEVAAYRIELGEWSDYFTRKDAAPGLPANYIHNPGELKALTTYFAWAAWATTANRPGKDYSYTNNWPYEPMAGNLPSTEAYVWSALSLITLLSGLGLILFVVGKFDYLGWKGEGAGPHFLHSAPATLKLTPSQWATGWFFAVVALLFLAQSFLGGLIAHYRVETGAFYGFDIARWLPYTLARTWHLQLAIFWIATSWVGGGLFLATWVGGEEPKHQKTGVYALLGALVLVVVGSLAGESLGINDKLGQLWFWFGHQGSEYLDLGRLWQFLLAVGLIFWLFLMFRALRPAFKSPEKARTVLTLSVRGRGHPCLLPARPFLWPSHQLRRHRQLALLDHPSLGGGILRTLRDGAGGHHVPPDGRGQHQNRHAPNLPGCHPVSQRRDHRHRPPLVLHRPGNAQHGLGVVLLRSGSSASNASDSVRMGFHQAEKGGVFRVRPRSGLEPEVVHLLPHGRGCLELRRRRGLRFPDQPADRVLLRGGHVAHRQSRTRRTVWCLWDVGLSSPGLLLEGHAIRHHMEGDGEVRPGGLLGR